MIRTRWGLIAVALAVSILAGAGTAHSQGLTSPLFVVYGVMENEDHIPIEGTYAIIVTNVHRGVTIEDELGTGDDAGKYCAVFLDYADMIAVVEGDQIRVKARKIGEEGLYLYAKYTVTPEDVAGMCVTIDMVEGRVAIETKTWGAIKSLCR